MTADLLKTPLYDLHVELGARMVPFAGYAMPVQYPSGLMAEHRHTRTAAGLFDVSHMGQLRLAGPKPPRPSRPWCRSTSSASASTASATACC